MSDENRAWRDKGPNDNTLPSILGERSEPDLPRNNWSKAYFILALTLLLIAASLSIFLLFRNMLINERDIYYAKIKDLETERKNIEDDCKKRSAELRAAIQETREELLKTIIRNKEIFNKSNN